MALGSPGPACAQLCSGGAVGAPRKHWALLPVGSPSAAVSPGNWLPLISSQTRSSQILKRPHLFFSLWFRFFILF